MQKEEQKNSQKNEKSEHVTVALFNDEMQNIDKRFDDVDKRFDKVEIDIAGLKYDMKEVKGDIKRIETKMDENQNTLITILDKHTKLMENMQDDFQIIKSENKQIKQVIKNKFDIGIVASAA